MRYLHGTNWRGWGAALEVGDCIAAAHFRHCAAYRVSQKYKSACKERTGEIPGPSSEEMEFRLMFLAVEPEVHNRAQGKHDLRQGALK